MAKTNTNKYYVRQLEDQVRGTKKRIKSVDKASRNNHVGMMYWKERALNAEADLAMISTIVENTFRQEIKADTA